MLTHQKEKTREIVFFCWAVNECHQIACLLHVFEERTAHETASDVHCSESAGALFPVDRFSISFLGEEGAFTFLTNE